MLGYVLYLKFTLTAHLSTLPNTSSTSCQLCLCTFDSSPLFYLTALSIKSSFFVSIILLQLAASGSNHASRASCGATFRATGFRKCRTQVSPWSYALSERETDVCDSSCPNECDAKERPKTEARARQTLQSTTKEEVPRKHRDIAVKDIETSKEASHCSAVDDRDQNAGLKLDSDQSKRGGEGCDTLHLDDHSGPHLRRWLQEVEKEEYWHPLKLRD